MGRKESNQTNKLLIIQNKTSSPEDLEYNEILLYLCCLFSAGLTDSQPAEVDSEDETETQGEREREYYCRATVRH